MVPPCCMIQFLKSFISSLISSQCGLIWLTILSDQFSSVAQLYLTLYDHRDCSTPGFPVHHQLPELAQTHAHWVGDAIQLSHPLLSLSLPAFKLYSMLLKSPCHCIWACSFQIIRWLNSRSSSLRAPYLSVQFASYKKAFLQEESVWLRKHHWWTFSVSH